MASWADNIESLTRYNPYVQQQPVEAMVEVGMKKQQLYDEGIRKIQANIDRISGLDIVRDVDRKYLQSKLTQLKSDLKTVAAGDFSNYQLTNHVAGMASSIGKDPTIITAVGSTAFYRKQLEQMQKDNNEGKANPANNFRFNRRANEWLSSENVGESFSTNYIPPIDVWSKLKDISSAVGIDVQDIQQLYQTDTQGNILYKDITDPVTKKVVGKEPQWNPIMVEKILKGKDAGKILTALQTALTPADYQQLSINGEYEKASYTPKMLIKEIEESSQSQMDFVNDKIQSIKIDLLQENQKNEKNPERIESLNKQLSYFQQSLETITTSRDKNIELVNSNPDAVRASLYTNNYLHNMSKALSSQDVSIKYSVSPMFEVTMEQNKFNRDIQRDKIADIHWSEEMRLKWATLQHQIDKDNADAAAKLAESEKTGEYLPLLIDVNSPTMVKDMMEKEYNDMVTVRNSINDKIATEYYRRSNPKIAGEKSEDYERRIINKMIEDSGGNLDDYKAKITDDRIAEWTKDNNNIPAEYRSLINDRNELNKKLLNKEWQIKQVKEESAADAQLQGIVIKSDEEIKSNLKGKVVTIRQYIGSPGIPVYLSEEDILDFAYASPGIFKSKARKEKQAIAKEKLMNKFGESYKTIANHIFNDLGEIMDEDVSKAKSMINYSDYKELAKIENQKYIDKGYIERPLSMPLKRGKENKDDFNSEVSAVMSKYRDIPEYRKEMENMQKIFLSDNGATVNVEAHPGGELNMVVKTSSGDEKKMVIDTDDYRLLTNRDAPKHVSKPAVVEIIENAGNTNHSNSVDSPETAWFTSKDFSNLKKYSATSDYVRDFSNPNIVWMKINIFENGKYVETLTFPDKRLTNSPIYLYDPITSTYNKNLEGLPSVFTDDDIDKLRNKE